MLFKPRKCPNCAIKWQDNAHPGQCDLCGYDLRKGGQSAKPYRGSDSWKPASIEVIQPQQAQKIPKPTGNEFSKVAYRPFLPGVEIRDPKNILSNLDPMLLSDMQVRMEKILGRKGEEMGRGKLSNKELIKTQAILQLLAASMKVTPVEMFLDSEEPTLPLRATVLPEGQWPEEGAARPLSQTSAQPASKMQKLMRIILVIAGLIYMVLMFFMDKK